MELCNTLCPDLKPLSGLCLHLQVITQVALVGLLFGTLCGDFALVSDVGQRAVGRLWLGTPPGQPGLWLRPATFKFSIQ